MSRVVDALRQTPALRALPSPELAMVLGVPYEEAAHGIAAAIGVPSIGPLQSYDQASAAHSQIGPIVRSPSPMYDHPKQAAAYFEAGVVVGGEHTVGDYSDASIYGVSPNSAAYIAGLGLDAILASSGCGDCTNSALRQSVYAFKQAALQDGLPVSFNMVGDAAFAYGPGTDTALRMVLGSKRTYGGGACTDSSGNCLGTSPRPQPGPQPMPPQPQPQVEPQSQSSLGWLAIAAAAGLAFFLLRKKKR